MDADLAFFDSIDGTIESLVFEAGHEWTDDFRERAGSFLARGAPLMAQPFTVALEGGDAVGALAYAAGGPTSAEATVILAHGAGAPQTHQFMTSFAKGLSTRGLDVITFNFLYMERKRRAPGPAARLEACYRAVIDTARQRMKLESQRLVVGGKSMGGRIASQVVAAGTEAGGTTADGLVLLGSPLHPPGRPDKLRDVHLPAITAPMLFVQGSP